MSLTSTYQTHRYQIQLPSDTPAFAEAMQEPLVAFRSVIQDIIFMEIALNLIEKICIDECMSLFYKKKSFIYFFFRLMGWQFLLHPTILPLSLCPFDSRGRALPSLSLSLQPSGMKVAISTSSCSFAMPHFSPKYL